MAMRGKNCVAIAADRRFGIQAQMVTTDFQKIFPMGDRLYIGLAGLATDVQTVWVYCKLFFIKCLFHLQVIIYILQNDRQPSGLIVIPTNTIKKKCKKYKSCLLHTCVRKQQKIAHVVRFDKSKKQW